MFLTPLLHPVSQAIRF